MYTPANIIYISLLSKKIKQILHSQLTLTYKISTIVGYKGEIQILFTKVITKIYI